MSHLWSGRFEGDPDAALFEFGASFRFDRRLFPDDVLGSQAWAEALLAREPELGLLVMGHTHQAACLTTPRGAHYLNPGAWFDGFRYAVASETGAELRRFTPTAPPPPVPADRR